MSAITVRNDDRGERDLPAGQGQRVHLRIGGRKSDSQKMEETFQGSAGEGEGLADDEVLHAIGGNEHRVVTVCVGGEKLVTEDFDVDFAGEEVVVTPSERR